MAVDTGGAEMDGFRMDQVLGVNCKALQPVPLDGLEPSNEPGSSSQGHLLGHVLRFGQLLRVMGVDVSTSQVLDLTRALQHISITSRFDFYHTCRALLITRHEDFLVFDQAFTLFWRADSLTEEDNPLASNADVKRLRLPSELALDDGISGGSVGSERDRPTSGEGEGEHAPTDPWMVYSPQEILRQKDFGEMTWEEIQEAKRAIANLEWRLGERRTRRFHSGYKGRLHLRHMIRANLRHGGEPIYLAFRQRTYRPRSLVVLCDISGSMERYSRMLLHFIHALTHGLMDTSVEAFVFGTRLTRITRHLRYKDVDESMDVLGEVVQEWSGGTRIGKALKDFNFEWARRVLGRGAVVLIISDGWDRGDTDLLAQEMARLQRSAYRLIWLNPLLGSGEYVPVQRGMVASMPYVDDFLPVHNLASLQQLAEVLSSVATLRPVRKQHSYRLSQQITPGDQLRPLDQRVAEQYPFLRPYLGLRRSH
jgi:uncharacterized protein with von Willebrand factor type A (vWA) domain